MLKLVVAPAFTAAVGILVTQAYNHYFQPIHPISPAWGAAFGVAANIPINHHVLVPASKVVVVPVVKAAPLVFVLLAVVLFYVGLILAAFGAVVGLVLLLLG